jgi:hypothetical protein
VRGLFDPLFDLLKGIISAEDFELTAEYNTGAVFENLYRSGYERWLALSLLKLFDADSLLHPAVDESLTLYDAHKRGGFLFEDSPTPEGAHSIIFRYRPDEAVIVPDLLFHSKRTGKYISIRSQMGKPFALVPRVSQEAEWKYLPPDTTFDPGLTMIYVNDYPGNISLVADKEKICRPALIIECMTQKGWHETEKVEAIKRHHEFYKPELGMFILSGDAVPEQLISGPENDIHVIAAAFEQSMLEPVIAAFSVSEASK